jgi:KDO2-lipid IV(A) lauroyltransferase
MPRRVPPRQRLLHLLEGALVYAVYLLLAALPMRAASAIGGAVARTLGPLIPVTRRARRNLVLAFPEKPPAEIERIIRGMWDNLGRTAAEYPHIQALWEEDLVERALVIGEAAFKRAAAEGKPLVLAGKRIEVAGVEHIFDLEFNPQAAIIFSAHMGNWELMPLWSARLGMPATVVYRTPNNPYVARLIARIRAGMGTLLPKGVLGAVLSGKVLEEGRLLGILVDQKQNRGLPIPFFGRPAMTAPMLGRLALKFRCPVLGAWVQRLDGQRFRITVTPPLALPDSGDPAADVAALMTEVNAAVEGWIRERPDQWMWIHRRWSK